MKTRFEVTWGDAVLGIAVLADGRVTYRPAPTAEAKQVLEGRPDAWLREFRSTVRYLVKGLGHLSQGAWNSSQDLTTKIRVERL